MSLTGIPFLAGFIGKFIVFGLLMEEASVMHVSLAAIGVANSVVSLYYYFRIVRAMTLDRAEEDVVGQYRLQFVDRAVLWAVSIALIFLFLRWEGLLSIAEASRLLVAAN